MTTGAKIGLLTAAAALAWLVYEWASKLSIKFKSFGIPVISGSNLAVPVTLTINNPLPVTVSIDSLKIGLFILRNGMFDQFGQAISPAIALTPGLKSVTVNPVIDLKKLVPTTPTLQTALTLITGQSALATVKIIVQATVQGVPFTKEEVHQVSLNQFLRAA